MKTKEILLSIFLGIVATISLAQNPDENKSAEEIEDAINNMLGSLMQQGNKANEAKLPPTYSFDYIMNMTTWEEGKENKKNTVAFMWDNKKKYTGVKNEGDYIIIDNDQEIIVQYDNQEKEANVMPNVMKSFSSFLNESAEENKTKIISIKRTGNRKMIHGLKCEEILVETEDANSKNWVTYDLNTSLQEILSSSMGVQLESFIDEQYSEEFKDAMALYSESTNKKDGEKSFMEVTGIERNFSVNNSNYTIQRMGSNQ